MFKFCKALNIRANKINNHEMLALLKKSIYEKNAKNFPNATIDSQIRHRKPLLLHQYNFC